MVGLPTPGFLPAPRVYAILRLRLWLGSLWGCGEMADAYALGAYVARRVGSSPTIPTTNYQIWQANPTRCSKVATPYAALKSFFAEEQVLNLAQPKPCRNQSFT